MTKPLFADKWYGSKLQTDELRKEMQHVYETIALGYTSDEVDTLLADYYTSEEVDTLLTGYSATGHTHTTADITDLASYTGLDARYYTESEIDTTLGDYWDTTSLPITSGTWTPALQGSGSNPTVTYAEQTGQYVRIGSLVWAMFRTQWTAYSGGSGDLHISGLPVTVVSGSSFNSGALISWNLTLPASRSWAVLRPEPSTTYMRIAAMGSAVSLSTIQTSALTTTGYLGGTVVYRV